MKIYSVLFIGVFALGMTACSTPQNREAKAQAAYTEEKTATLQEYKKCVEEAAADEAKMAQCEALLKAVQAVEGGK